jgi:cyclohexanone monooxygenase
MQPQRHEALIIGAGFAGMHMLWKLREMGMAAIVLEQGGDVGGTWYWNRYPGARCDVPSMEYSYAFDAELEQEWEWTERYAGQPEILRYASHVADRLDLRQDIRFDTRVVSIAYDDARALWVVGTEAGDTFEATFCITASGCLSTPNIPPIPGIDRFEGRLVHTSRWPREPMPLGDLRVGVIGTGSTGVQAATAIAAQAEHLYVFQRTAQYSLPAFNAPLDPQQQTAMKARYPDHRSWQRTSIAGQEIDPPVGARVLDHPADQREQVFEANWNKGRQDILGCYADIWSDAEANAEVSDFVRRKIRGIVEDPVVAERLCPNDHPIGTRRIIMDTGYYEIFNQPNVTLVDIRATPIEITETGVHIGAEDYPLDLLVVATGFDAITGPLLAMNIRGRDGVKLEDLWRDGPSTYLGLMIAGFPNLFTITGPGSPSVHANVIFSIEQHVDWIADCLTHMRTTGATTVEAMPDAQRDWSSHVTEVGEQGLRATVDSWWRGANIPGKPRTVLAYRGGLGAYRRKCEEIVADGYRGFRFEGHRR